MRLGYVPTILKVLWVLTASCAAIAHAQTFPTQRVTLIVPYAPGGPTDVVVRIVGASLGKLWNQPLIVENRPGAAAVMGSNVVAKAKPDGYTLLANSEIAWTSAIFIKNLPYQPDDLVAVAKMAGSNYVLVASQESGVTSFKDFVALVKANPGKFTYGTIPNGTQDLAFELFKQKLGIALLKVPYNSAAVIQTAVLRNDVNFYFAIPASVAGSVVDRKMTPLAMLGATRSGNAPYQSVPTPREFGLEFQAGFDLGIIVPKGTPDPVIRKLGADVAAVLKDPEVSGALKRTGYDVPTDPLAWPSDLRKTLDDYFRIAKVLKIEPE